MAEDARVTVVVVVWGHYVRYLDGCLESLRDQHCPLEIIVVDNASEEPIHISARDVRTVRIEERVSLGVPETSDSTVPIAQ